MKTKKNKTQPEKLPAQLASEIGLRCKQYIQTRPGHFAPCFNPATGHAPGGDSCDDHRVRPQVRYATARRMVVEKAA